VVRRLPPLRSDIPDDRTVIARSLAPHSFCDPAGEIVRTGVHRRQIEALIVEQQQARQAESSEAASADSADE